MSVNFGRGGLYAAQLVLNAISAYAFQKAIAFHFGASADKSAFDIAFSIPFFLVYASGLGMTHSIVVVLFSREECQRDPALAGRRFSTLLNLTLLVLGGLSLLVAGLATPLAELLAPGLPLEQRRQVSELTLALLPLSVTFGVGSLLSALAVAYRIPLSQEVVLLVGRVLVVAWMLSTVGEVGLLPVSLVFVVATALAVVGLWLAVRRYTPLRYRLLVDLGEPEVRHALHQFAGFMVVAAVGQFAAAYTRRMATMIEPALVATLGFAASLLEPVGTILGKSAMYVWGDRLMAVRAGPGRSGGRDLVLLLALCFVSAGLLALVLHAAMPVIVALLFGGGAFDARAVDATTAVGRLMVAQLPFHLVTWLVLYPLLGIFRQAAAMTYLVGYATQIAFVWAFTPSLGAVGLALSYPAFTAMQALFGVALIAWASRRASRVAGG